MKRDAEQHVLNFSLSQRLTVPKLSLDFIKEIRSNIWGVSSTRSLALQTFGTRDSKAWPREFCGSNNVERFRKGKPSAVNLLVGFNSVGEAKISI